MSEKVRCLDCGHEWDCSADYPQCSDPNDECGRSRNVEPISELEGSDSQTPDQPSERDDENRQKAGESQSQDSDSGWSPIFDAEQTETEPIDSPGENLTGGSETRTESDPTESDEDAPDFGNDAVTPELTGDDIEMFIKTPFDMAARQRGEHWELEDNELNQLSESYARVANKYGPTLMGEYGPEVLALMTTMAVCGPRLAEDRKNAEDESESETDTEPDAGRTRTETETTDATDTNTGSGFAYSQV